MGRWMRISRAADLLQLWSVVPDQIRSALWWLVFSIIGGTIWAWFSKWPLELLIPLAAATVAFAVGAAAGFTYIVRRRRDNQHRFSRAPLVEFYGSRKELNALTGGIQEEMKRVSVAWLAAPTANFATAASAFASRRIEKVVLIKPDGEHVKTFVNAVPDSSLEHITSVIRNTTRAAQEGAADVYWFDGPVMNILFGDPRDAQRAWVRVGFNHPFGREHFGFTMKRSDYPDSFDQLKRSYEELIEHSDRAPMLGRLSP